jgi:hypothetical protein
MEILLIIAAVLLIGHIIFHPLRTLGCLIEAVVGIFLGLVILGAIAELALRHH